ncbi:MAG: hypothetical protein JWO41_158 [Candidatus Saccharibacteria bacterium]|nr:hypothetical protein [Candidatus Saccharibacteria bacterium]
MTTLEAPTNPGSFTSYINHQFEQGAGPLSHDEFSRAYGNEVAYYRAQIEQYVELVTIPEQQTSA